ncbi:unnamed protein product [Prorocentrum cordatum]|uniref:Uncharacterized protein n=1 Tax=Prorocentrum cordatum TaxID=2364126 RepID=A0ABN9WLR2_9DINO|nr:unnamed protein product [Polarella glacialis]
MVNNTWYKNHCQSRYANHQNRSGNYTVATTQCQQRSGSSVVSRCQNVVSNVVHATSAKRSHVEMGAAFALARCFGAQGAGPSRKTAHLKRHLEQLRARRKKEQLRAACSKTSRSSSKLHCTTFSSRSF